MKKIKLLNIKVENFMMYASAEFSFGNVTKIFGANGKGKSSIASAYMWLLFNCDYNLADNPVVRHEINGSPVNDVDVSVEATLEMDGRIITAKKVQKRKFGKDGVSYKDDNSYFINDVPKTLTAFNEYFAVDMKVFRMCSNIDAFLNQKPDEMRKFLFQTVEDVSDLDVAKKHEELCELVPLLEEYSLEELSAMNKKVVADIKKEMPIREGQINEKQRDISIKQSKDVGELELKKNALKSALDENLAKQNDNEKIFSERQAITDSILELKLQLSKLQNDANQELNEHKNSLRAKKNEIANKLVEIGLKITRNERELEQCRAILAAEDRERNTLAVMWRSANAEVFDENQETCPTCGRKLPDEEIVKLRSEFTAKKAERIGLIEEKGKKSREELENAKTSIKSLEEENGKRGESEIKLKAEMAGVEKELESLPSFVDISYMDEYKHLNAEIAKKQEEMSHGISVKEIRQKLKEEEVNLRMQLSDCIAEINATNTEQDEKRLDELMSGRIMMAQKQADAEKILHLLDELNKAKNDSMLNEINSKFSLVRWKLWTLSKAGDYKNVCVPMVDDKSILTTMSNKGNRILGRIDICQGIQKIAGINVPIFLDDFESLSTANQFKAVDMIDGQVIAMIVTDDDKLRVRDIKCVNLK